MVVFSSPSQCKGRQGDENHVMLDLFSGTGSASLPFWEVGWQTTRVELNPRFPAEVHADIETYVYEGPPPTLVWASPPCTEFTREFLPWHRTGVVPSMTLIEATDRIIRECRPRYWVIENTRGASKYLTPRYGPARVHGSVFLWGVFPRFEAVVLPWKYATTHREERGLIPRSISTALLKAVEEDLWFSSPSWIDKLGEAYA